MLVVHVRPDGQELRSHHFKQSELTVGQVHGQDRELPAGEVSRRHARIACHGARIRWLDNGSTSGTNVNGRRIQSMQALCKHANEKVQPHQHVLEYEAG